MPAPVVLWDVDGTLLRAPGVGVRAFTTAVERVTGVAWTPRRLDFGGRTDPEIAGLVLEDAGVPDSALVPLVLEAVAIVYEELADELARAVRVLPGVASVIPTLDERRAVQTVVTGNLRAVAGAKIAAAGLGEALRLELGGYGSDHHDRSALVRLALDRLVAAGLDVPLDRVWVVGDTPRDLACAQANGVRCALVATGTHDVETLQTLDADLVLADLSDPAALLDAIG